MHLSVFRSEWEGEWHEAFYRLNTLVGKVMPEKTCSRVFFISCETTVAVGWSNECGQAHHLFFGPDSSLAGRAIR